MQVGEYQGAYKVSTSSHFLVTCCTHKVRGYLRQPAGVTCKSPSSEWDLLPADHEGAVAKVWSRARTRHAYHRGAAAFSLVISPGA